jgi:predicted Zn finger-like uncharacterized protein
MIVTCSNCTTRLQLDAAKVPSRPFSVRCPKCQQIVNVQPSAPPAQRDAMAAVGNIPASTRSQQEASATTHIPVMREEAAPPDAQEEVLRLLASILRRGSGGDVSGAAASNGRRAWERRRALVCAGSGFGDDAARALDDARYGVIVADDTAQAIERMREEMVDVVVLDPEFDVRAQGAAQISRELSSMRTAERRRVVLVLLSNTARTGDAHAAFLAGANLVVQMKEASELALALERNIRDLNELYRDFNKALGLAEL